MMSKGSSRLAFRPDLEGLRAVAILLVVAVHAGFTWLPGGFIGVDVFYVLSGFLITGLIVTELNTADSLKFAAFYVRRLRRLLPALMLMVLVVVAVTVLLLSPFEQQEQTSAAAMTVLWLSNFKFALAQQNYFSPSAETNLFLHTWSLGVEEQFYLLWPALLVWLLGKQNDRSMLRLKIGMLVVLVASLAACVLLTYKEPLLAFYMMPMRAWQFAAGALVWLCFMETRAETQGWWQQPGSLRWCGWIGLAMVVAAAILLTNKMPYPGFYGLLPTLGTAAVIAAGCSDNKSGVGKFLSWQPLQRLGGLSYSWYLWHWPVLLLGRAVTGDNSPLSRLLWVAVSLLLAWLSYRLVEQPLRQQKWWLSRQGKVIFASVAVMLLMNVFCVHWYNQATHRVHSPAMQRYAMAKSDAPVIYGMGCDDWYFSAEVRVCAFGNAKAKHTVVLMGDSHAGQWFTTLTEAYDLSKWRLLVLTKSSCPMADEPYFYARIGKLYDVCATWRKDALAKVAALHPDVVIMGSVANDQFSKQQWIEGTIKVLDVLSPAVGKVYILRDTPKLPFDGPDCLAKHTGRSDWLGLQQVCQAASINHHQEQVFQWLSQAASQFANVSMLDMNRFICPNGRCEAERKGVVVFRDFQHLTASYAATLGADFLQSEQ